MRMMTVGAAILGAMLCVACEAMPIQWSVNYACKDEAWPVYTATVLATVRGEAMRQATSEGEPICGIGAVTLGAIEVTPSK